MGNLHEEGVRSAKQHFPNRAWEIDALAQDSEDFRDLCEELATAEAALAGVDQAREGVRAERRLEWLSFIRSALAQIDAELERFNVVRIDRRGRREP
jgi:hypothetical protein